MESSKLTDYHGNTIVEQVDKEVLKKYLCPKGQLMMQRTVYNTVNEMYARRSDGKIADVDADYEETNTTSGLLPFEETHERKFYPVMFVGAHVKGEVTEDHIKQFCELLNEPIEAGDYFYGFLSGAVLKYRLSELNTNDQKFRDEEWVLVSMPLGRDINMTVADYRAKYPHLNIFIYEGELPPRILK